MIDVVQEQVQRAHALFEAKLDRAPLVGSDDARHQVEGHDLFDALGRLVHRKSDPARLERQVGSALAALDLDAAERRQFADQRRIVLAHLPLGDEHLIPELAGLVGEGIGCRADGGHAAVVRQSACDLEACLLQCNLPVAAPVKTPEVDVTSAKSRPVATTM